MRLLAYRERSEEEMRDRLAKKGFPEDVSARTVGYLREAGFLNDERLAAHLREKAFAEKRLGFSAARGFLSNRGVPRDVIDTTLVYDEDAEVERILRLMERKRRLSPRPGAREQARAWSFLVRRGYSVSAIRRALNNLIYKEEDGE